MGDERQIEPRRLPFLRSGRRLTRDLLYCYALADLKKAMPLILVPNFSCDVVENRGRRRLARKEAFFASRGFLVMRRTLTLSDIRFVHSLLARGKVHVHI